MNYTMTLTLLIGGTLTALTIMGCGSDGGRNTPGSSSFPGTYEIETWVENKGGCDLAAAESILETESDKMMVVETCSLSFLGKTESYLHAFKCKDEAECEADKCEPNEISFSGYSFESGSDSNGWSASSVSGGGSPSSDTCTAFVSETMLTSGADGRLVVTKTTKKIEEVSKDSEGWCDLDKAKEMAANAACTEIEVITLVKPGTGSMATGSDGGDGATEGTTDDGGNNDGTTDAGADG